MSSLRSKDTAMLIEPPVSLDNFARARLTASCRDSDSIPRTADAGEIVMGSCGKRVQIMHNGLRIIAGEYGGEWTAKIINDLKGVHEPQEELVFYHLLNHLPQLSTMIEIGANWSYYSLWFVSHAPETRRAIGVEPDPHNLSIGQLNCNLNRLKIDYIQAFISAQDKPDVEFKTEVSGVLRVDGLSISTIFERAKITNADLLLCDAQGGEIALLLSLGDVVRTGRLGVAMISTHSHHITGDPLTHQRALALVGDLGGRVCLEYDVQESYSGDGLIVADFSNMLHEWEPPRISRNRYSQSLFRNPLWDLAAVQATRTWKLTRPLRWFEAKLKRALNQR